ncbi:endo alpha-1,4 polygalactosaminidase [Legionella maceachernii]|uniref:Glycoside-hydrolase family GH114 TIM-barrel domain-containing protein n=1 Tax=Legionella maceachernii TaxID=466 RepID=A0A0W0VY43_9GAMM|nr:endo alpha-1,4 polygalactosaminidase [Legionella maceachernii]KTD25120.1 hypothetical protein Lmac_2098 [Legionella maceachernii]SKA28934.1 Glycoside-hydrolase family GH114 [Legionella maceachernii]SUP02516.1 Uncharacterized conserved protein [Legionella maceachernii]
MPFIAKLKSNVLSPKGSIVSKKGVFTAIFILTLVSTSFAQTNGLEPPEFCLDCTTQITPAVKWNAILSEIPRFTVPVNVYDIDGFDNSAKIVATIHAKNAKAICYLNAGAWEDWRPDAKDFPEALKGKSNGWEGEKWLDISQISQLLPIMEARITMCKNKGFDAIDFDNVDGYTNKTGFPLTAEDQLNYNTKLANLAHKAGLAVGLKNDLDQIEQLEPYFDFAINEQCFYYNECQLLTPFVRVNKAVFNIEYDLKPSQFCAKANELYFSSIKKDKKLAEKPVHFCN